MINPNISNHIRFHFFFLPFSSAAGAGSAFSSSGIYFWGLVWATTETTSFLGTSFNSSRCCILLKLGIKANSILKGAYWFQCKVSQLGNVALILDLTLYCKYYNCLAFNWLLKFNKLCNNLFWLFDKGS